MKYIIKTLQNQMKIIMIPMKKTNTVAMGFFVKAGSRNEFAENNGIAHFLEHMMFKGTSNRSVSELFNELDSINATYNAVTTTQYTYYYVSGFDIHMKKLLDIIIDMYINPIFLTKQINLERKVIMEEMRIRMDSPLMKLYTVLHKILFPNTSLSLSTIGTPQTVDSFKKSDFVEFRSGLYKPSNTVFVISGNFNPILTYKLIFPSLCALTNSKIQPKLYADEGPIILQKMHNQLEPYVYIKKNDFFQQAYVLMAFPMYDLYKTKYAPINILSDLLTLGFSSRLIQSLREKNGITYSSASYPVVYSDCGLFFIQMVLNPTSLVQGLKILLKELKKIKNELMSPEEMKRLIGIAISEKRNALSSPMDVLTYFGLNFISDRTFKPDLNKDIEELKNMKRSDVKDVAGEIFLRDKINLFIYGNVEQENFDFLSL